MPQKTPRNKYLPVRSHSQGPDVPRKPIFSLCNIPSSGIPHLDIGVPLIDIPPLKCFTHINPILRKPVRFRDVSDWIISFFSRAEVETFLPSMEKLSTWKDRNALIRFPLFPGYLVVNLYTSHQAQLTALKTRGVSGIPGAVPGEPKPVPEKQLLPLKTQPKGFKLVIDKISKILSSLINSTTIQLLLMILL